MTAKYPDIAARIPGLLSPGVQSAVLDGEAVAWDPVHKKILPFQVSNLMECVQECVVYGPDIHRSCLSRAV
jgi:hypothetical protein